ncbi:hypothetical protein [Streptomyces sp. NPDC096013]|uniref:hypothetical protein n=1 Tax=Streptomyces sp. NPDC096013 TaxID=3366069 RepID=UPI0037F8621D
MRCASCTTLPRRNPGRPGQMSATGFEQLHSSPSPDRQTELEERQSALGTAVVRLRLTANAPATPRRPALKPWNRP